MAENRNVQEVVPQPSPPAPPPQPPKPPQPQGPATPPPEEPFVPLYSMREVVLHAHSAMTIECTWFAYLERNEVGIVVPATEWRQPFLNFHPEEGLVVAPTSLEPNFT